MSLQERVSQEIKAAMLAKDAERLSALRMLKSTVDYAKIEHKTESLPDADIVEFSKLLASHIPPHGAVEGANPIVASWAEIDAMGKPTVSTGNDAAAGTSMSNEASA